MKRKLPGIIIISLVLVSMLFSGAAYAQDEELPSPGLTPDSPFYFFDKLGKNIGMFFTFGSEAKARKALRYAGERLAEAQEMASANKTAALERAIADFEKYIAQLQEKLAQIKELVASDNISERAALAMLKHLDVLEKVKEKAPERVRNAITHAENISMDGQINSLRALGRQKPEKALDICANVTERQLEKIRIRATDNATSANITEALDYTERIAALEDELAEKAESTGGNVTALQERLAHSTANRLEVLSGVYEIAPVQARPAIENAIENSVKKFERTIEKLEDKNVLTAVSVNETMEKIPAELRARIQVSTSNRLQIINAGPDNATTAVRITTEKQEQNRERLENKENPDMVAMSANQTREQPEIEKQEKNIRNTP
jgi:hypothetical protein